MKIRKTVIPPDPVRGACRSKPWSTAMASKSPSCASSSKEPCASVSKKSPSWFSPGAEIRYARGASDHAGRLRFVPQPEPLGYGHAVVCARDFVGQDPLLHLVGDRLYIGRPKRAARSIWRKWPKPRRAPSRPCRPPVVGRYHGTGRTTRNGSPFPNGNAFVRGLWPYPTMTGPSAETPSSSTRATHLSAVWTPAACNNILRSCIPVLAVQTKHRLDPVEPVVSDVPTITVPSALAANAALSGPPRLPISCMPVEAVQRNARQKPLASRASPTITRLLAEMAVAMLSAPVVSPRSCKSPAGVHWNAWKVAPLASEPLIAAPTATGACPVPERPNAWV